MALSLIIKPVFCSADYGKFSEYITDMIYNQRLSPPAATIAHPSRFQRCLCCSYKLSAPTGMVASKIGCPQGTPWDLERVNMNDAFKGFTDWVTKTTPADWYNYKVTGKYFE